MPHYLASGVVVLKENNVLLVRDKNGWSLPKGAIEAGETFIEAALREGNEETGYDISVSEVAFTTEYTTKAYGQYLQVYFSGEVISNQKSDSDPDEDVLEVKFVSINNIRDYIKFRPWIIPLEYWISKRIMKYYTFDLDAEGFDI